MKRIIGLVLVLMLLPFLQASDDEVVLVNPKAQLLGSVVVSGDHFDISAGGARTSFKGDRVVSIVFDTELNDQDWMVGQAAFWDKRWPVCYERLTPVIRLLENGGEFREMCVPFAYYYFAVAAGKIGKGDVSKAYFQKAFASPLFPATHPLYSRALTDAAMLGLESKDISAAKAMLPRLREADATLGAYVAAEVALAEKDLTTATTQFESLAASKDPVMKARGQMGATRVSIANKKYDDAIKTANAAIAGGSGNDLIQSDGYYYLGLALQAKAISGATDNEKAELLQQASMAFMRVIAVYTDSDKRLLAADGAIDCFEKLGSFGARVESLKGIPYGKYAGKIQGWKSQQAAN